MADVKDVSYNIQLGEYKMQLLITITGLTPTRQVRLIEEINRAGAAVTTMNSFNNTVQLELLIVGDSTLVNTLHIILNHCNINLMAKDTVNAKGSTVEVLASMKPPKIGSVI